VGEPLSTLIIGLGLVRAMSPEEKRKGHRSRWPKFLFLAPRDGVNWLGDVNWLGSGWVEVVRGKHPSV
jgi:hypothetical protein